MPGTDLMRREYEESTKEIWVDFYRYYDNISCQEQFPIIPKNVIKNL